MKHILIILAIIGSVITSSAQSPRIKLNQITKDTTFGSILMSSMADSGLVYSRDFYINYGVDTFLVLYGDTITGSTVLSYVLSDSVTILGDGLLGNELRADTTVLATISALSDSLSLLISSVSTDGVTITGDGTVGSPLVVDTSTVISTIQGFLDTLVTRGYISAEQVQDTVANMIIAGLGIETTYNDADGEFLIESLSIEDSIKNQTGTLITKGTPLYATGVQGNYWTVAPADASDESKLPVVVIAGEDIADGGTGLGLIKGHIKNVNTSGFTAGDEIWLASGGGYTNVEPKGGGVYSQSLGTVIKVDASSGSGIINIQEPNETLAPDNIWIGGADSVVASINARDTFVTISDAQTINGAKTFSTDVEIDGKLDLNDGSSRVFVGTDAGANNTGAVSNGFGAYALYQNSGSESNGFGYVALYNNSGVQSNGFGYFALYNNSGIYSNGFGNHSLYSNSGNFSNGFGRFALYNNTGASANGFGYYALYNNSGAYSSGFGYQALYSNSGAYSSGFGYQALYSNSGGSSNGFGYQALRNNTGANSNGFGYLSLEDNTGANVNGFGHNTLRFNSGSNANGFGYQALLNNSGDYSNGFGYRALQTNSGANVNAFGFNALSINSGSNNTAIGHSAGYSADTLIGSNNTFLGANASYGVDSTISNSTAVGANVTLSNSNTVILGNNANVGIGTTSPSYKLDVVGDINFSGDLYDNGVLLSIDSIQVTSSTTNTDFPLVFSSATTTGSSSALINSDLIYNPSTTELNISGTELIVDNDNTGFSGTFKQTGTNNISYSDGSVTGINTYYNDTEEILNISGFQDDAYIFNPNVDGNIYIGTNSATNPSTAMSITDDKKVGINKLIPSYTLDVNGNIGFNGTLYKNDIPLFEDSIAYIWINDSTDHHLSFTGYYNDLRAVVYTVTANFNGCVLKELASNAYNATKEFRLLINGTTIEDYETDSTTPISHIALPQNISLSTGDYIEIRNDESTKSFSNTHIFHIRCPNP